MNCKKAAVLIEKKLDHPKNLSLYERLYLKIHLLMCALCTSFFQKSAIISRALKKGYSQKETHDLDSQEKQAILDAVLRKT